MVEFTPEFLDSIRERVPLTDIVSPHVNLKRTGREFSGLSPFKTEKTPSFTVVPEKGFYHCFSSGEHGDVFDFVMKIEGLSFPEAVEKLAARAGLEMPARDPQAARRAGERQTVQDAMEAAAAFHEKQLRMPEGREGLAYLHGRGLDDETIGRFRLGWAPANGQALPQMLAKAGFEDRMIVASGMVHAPRHDDEGPSAMLRRRVVFPVTDRRGRVIAFGGRTLGAGQPKYLNTAESPVFRKRETLYGLAQAREDAWRKREIVVVEGYMDAIALSQAGFPQTVAALGTAFGEDHLKALWQIVDEPVFCFDGDEAGQRAARRVAERALEAIRPGKSLRFATLPEGKDPDDLVRAPGGPEALRAALDGAETLVGTLWTSELRFENPQSASAKAGCLRALLTLCGRIGDRDLRAFHEREVQDRCHKEFGIVPSVPDGRRNRPRPRPGGDAGIGLSGDTIRAMQVILAVVRHPQLAHEFDEQIGGYSCDNEALQALLNGIGELTSQEAGEEAGPPDLSWDRFRKAGYEAAVDLFLSLRERPVAKHILAADDYGTARSLVERAFELSKPPGDDGEPNDGDAVRRQRRDIEEFRRQQMTEPPRPGDPRFWQHDRDPEERAAG